MPPLTSGYPSATDEMHGDADQRQYDEQVNGRGRDVKDDKTRDPGQRQDDRQKQQHAPPSPPRTPTRRLRRRRNPRQGMTYNLGASPETARGTRAELFEHNK